MTAPLILGGVYGASCVTCSAPRDHPCKTSKGEPKRTAHAARVKAAPPIVEAHVGDLVLVRHRGEHVAQLVEIGTVLTVRFWRPSAQVFASPRLLEREAVIGLAPDDARTAMARAELEHEALLADEGRLVDVTLDPPALASDIAEGRGPFDPGQDTSDPFADDATRAAGSVFHSRQRPDEGAPERLVDDDDEGQQGARARRR